MSNETILVFLIGVLVGIAVSFIGEMVSDKSKERKGKE